MKKEMVHRFPITTPHTTPIRQMEVTLSKERIWQWTAVDIKKATLLGTFTFQTPFQGKMELEASQISW